MGMNLLSQDGDAYRKTLGHPVISHTTATPDGTFSHAFKAYQLLTFSNVLFARE